jgi:hypothetical protein
VGGSHRHVHGAHHRGLCARTGICTDARSQEEPYGRAAAGGGSAVTTPEARCHEAENIIAGELEAVAIPLFLYAMIVSIQWRAVGGLAVAFLGCGYLTWRAVRLVWPFLACPQMTALPPFPPAKAVHWNVWILEAIRDEVAALAAQRGMSPSQLAQELPWKALTERRASMPSGGSRKTHGEVHA